jgi:hypothetical protein
MRLLALGLIAAFFTPLAQAQPMRPPRVISRDVLEDKIRGGWAGQIIGVSYGAPTEFRAQGRIIDENIGHYLDWTPDRVNGAVGQDDLYVEMTFAEVIERHGLDATTEQYGEMFRTSRYPLWHGNAAARRLLNLGVPAPLSGDPLYNAHSGDIDFQIESDFIGLMTPGLPIDANRIAGRAGRVMAWGDGLYGGMFIAGMYSAAFFETDPRRVVEAGLRSIPRESGYAEIIGDVLRWSSEHPDDWRATWQLIEDKWNSDPPCPDQAGSKANIDARLNGAYVVLGLLYGHADMNRTLEISTRAGQDSDCNPSSAAGILGVMLGYNAIPEQWRAGMPAIANRNFAFTTHSFNTIVAFSTERALELIRRAGGSAMDGQVTIPWQEPAPPPVEQWAIGPVREVFPYASPNWAYSSEFHERTDGDAGQEADGAGRATLHFTGSSVYILALTSESGGRAEVVLDGEPAGLINAWAPRDTFDPDVWHVSGLPDGPHVVEIRVLASADPRSNGARLRIMRAVAYGPGLRTAPH